MAESRLHQLSARGQSVWIDYLSRDLLETGELKRMMEEDAVVGPRDLAGMGEPGATSDQARRRHRVVGAPEGRHPVER